MTNITSIDQLHTQPELLPDALSALQWLPWTSLKDIPPQRHFIIEVCWPGDVPDYHLGYTRLAGNGSTIGVAGGVFISEYAKHITRYRFVDLLTN